MPVPTPSLPLHRIRFYDHTPSPIVASAFAPLPLPPARDPSRPAPSRQAAKDELGCLIVARENGSVEVWEYAREGSSFGNWLLARTLPPTLTHPTISLMALVIRDPETFYERGYSVPKLADLRLFTAGSDSSELTERCLFTGRILQTYAIPSPPLWSLTISPTHSLLCLTTNSAQLHFLTIPAPLNCSSVTPLEPAPTHLLRSDALPSRVRTVSVAWGVPKLEQDASGWRWRDTTLVTGNSDSSFRRWELPSPSSTGLGAARVSLRGRAVVEKVKSKKASQKGTIVWGVAVLPDGTVVTADSLGSVTFWDGASLAQRHSFRSHKADAMCLTVGPAGRTVFSSGPDQRVCQFTLVPSSSGSDWALTSTKRIHTHDVRTLSVFPPYLPLPAAHPLSSSSLNPGLAPVLFSGGWDMGLSFTPCAAPTLDADRLGNPLARPGPARQVVFEEAQTRRTASISPGHLSFARSARLVVGRKDRTVGIWRVLQDERGWEKVLDMDLKLRTNLVASTVSHDGRWLAVSDLYETKLFRLVHEAGTIRPRRVRSFLTTLHASPLLADLDLERKGTGASALLFTDDASRLVLALAESGCAVVLDLAREQMDVDGADHEVGVDVVRVFSPAHKQVAGRTVVGLRNGEANGETSGDEDDDADDDADAGRPRAWVTRMAASEDGQWLSTADQAGRVTIFNLDTLQLHATLPTFPQPPSAFEFTPTHPLLAIFHPTQALAFYDLEHRRLLPANHQVRTLNTRLSALHAPASFLAFEPSRANPRAARVVLASHDWLATARLDVDLILRPKEAATPRGVRRKRAREAREALELASASASASPSVSVASHSVSSASAAGSVRGAVSAAADPEFCKIDTDRFRAVVAVAWLAEAEMAVVERPQADYAAQLPPAFWSAGYGRA
ncbi:U3 small nucleolar RNA-associated protein [Cryptotrichosporon argae]